MTPFLIERLRAEGFSGVLVGRAAPVQLAQPGFSADSMDRDGASWRCPDGAAVLSLMPIWALGSRLQQLAGASRIIALSSSSIDGKADSADPTEQAIVDLLRRGEAALAEFAERERIGWTILRPTMIWDGSTDRNVTSVARFVARWGCFPVAGPARGLRQPIHADAVANALVRAVKVGTAGGSLALPGGETLSYRAMVSRISESLGVPPRIVTFPTGPLMAAATLARRLGLTKRSPAVLTRMNRDLAFDDAPARALLGDDYALGGFNPSFPWAQRAQITDSNP